MCVVNPFGLQPRPPADVQSTTMVLKALRCSTWKCDGCFKNANAVFASSVSISDLRITVETWQNCLSTTALRFDPSVSMAFFMKVVAWRRRLVIIARPICEVQISVVGWEIARRMCCCVEPYMYGRCRCWFVLCISIRAQAMCLQSIFANGIQPRKHRNIVNINHKQFQRESQGSVKPSVGHATDVA